MVPETPPSGPLVAPELGRTPQVPGSDHVGSCGHELDKWETHLAHVPDCPRELCLEDSCDCPEVCPECCRACGYDTAERMGS